jgi:hypothetical protein
VISSLWNELRGQAHQKRLLQRVPVFGTNSNQIERDSFTIAAMAATPLHGDRAYFRRLSTESLMSSAVVSTASFCLIMPEELATVLYDTSSTAAISA